MGRKKKGSANTTSSSSQEGATTTSAFTPASPFDRLAAHLESTSIAETSATSTATGGSSATASASSAPTTSLSTMMTTSSQQQQGSTDTLAKANDPNVEKNIQKLEEVQTELDKVKEKFVEERKKLAEKYLSDMLPHLSKRRAIIKGKDEDATANGVPGFWLKALQQHSEIGDFIEEWDEDVLQYLEDIEWSHLEDLNGFKLSFHFGENPYFKNAVLKKEIPINNMYDPAYASPDPTRISGCKIEWYPGKDVTVAPAKKKKGKKGKKGSNKSEKRESFFRFFDEFSIENVYEMDQDDAEELEFRLQSDVDIAMAIKDQVIPSAVKCYNGEMGDEDYEEEDDEDDEDEEAPLLEEEDDEEDTSEEEEGEEDVREAIKAAFSNKGGEGNDFSAIASQFQSQSGGSSGDQEEKPPECNQQ